jgi:pimeloyl-ACP methyl ester carboxylesterase
MQRSKIESIFRSLKTSLSSNFIKIGKYKVFYVKAGKGSPVVLIHGANMGSGQWYPNIDDLAKSHTVYAIDLPGSGRSTRDNYKQMNFNKDYVGTVVKFLQELKLKNTCLVGHSFGGAIAAKAAIAEPKLISKLVLVNPLGLIRKIPPKQRPVGIGLFAKFLAKGPMKPNRKNMKKFLQSAVYDKKVVSEDFVDYYYDSVNKDKRSHPMLFMHGQTKGPYFNPDMIFEDELKKLKQPVLIIIGENDPLLPSKQQTAFATKSKNVKLKVFKLTGHVPSLEKSDLFNKTVLQFLKGK